MTTRTWPGCTSITRSSNRTSWNGRKPKTCRCRKKVVDKMRLSQDKTMLYVNPSLTLAGIPPETFQYRLGNRSALE
jgi:predicted helicase